MFILFIISDDLYLCLLELLVILISYLASQTHQRIFQLPRCWRDIGSLILGSHILHKLIQHQRRFYVRLIVTVYYRKLCSLAFFTFSVGVWNGVKLASSPLLIYDFRKCYINIQLAKLISSCFDLRNILLSNQTNVTWLLIRTLLYVYYKWSYIGFRNEIKIGGHRLRFRDMTCGKLVVFD